MIGWPLLLSLLPESGAVGHYNYDPVFRDWQPARSDTIDLADYWQVTRAVFDLCMERVTAEPALWGDFIEHLDDLPPDYREEMYLALEKSQVNLDGDASLILWEALDDLSRKHREYDDAKWALPADEVARLEQVAQLFRPSSAALRDRWLFDDSLPHIGIHKGSDFENYDKALSTMRGDSAKEIWEEGGLDLTVQVARAVKSPAALGFGLAKSGIELPLEDLAGLLDDTSRTASELASTAVRTATKGELTELSNLADKFGKRPLVQARLLLMAHDLAGAWKRVESLGGDIDQAYWAEFYPFGRGADFPLVNETARKLADHRRWAAALDVLSHFRRNFKLDTNLIIESFTSMLHEGDPQMHVLSQYEIGELMSYLRESAEVPGEVLARLEWQLLPALDADPATSTLQKSLSESPEFFVEVISLLYRPHSAEAKEKALTETDKNMAGNAWRLLHDWKRVPGTVEGTNEIDLVVLTEWAAKARALLKAADRVAVGELQIGQVLAFAPSDDDGTWPAKPVRDFLEVNGTKKILDGLRTGIYNKRGVTSRGVTEGGGQEYALADKYDGWAEAVKIEWPKSARVLRAIATEYRVEGQRNDEAAQRAQEGFSF